LDATPVAQSAVAANMSAAAELPDEAALVPLQTAAACTPDWSADLLRPDLYPDSLAAPALCTSGACLLTVAAAAGSGSAKANVPSQADAFLDSPGNRAAALRPWHLRSPAPLGAAALSAAR